MQIFFSPPDLTSIKNLFCVASIRSGNVCSVQIFSTRLLFKTSLTHSFWFSCFPQTRHRGEMNSFENWIYFSKLKKRKITYQTRRSLLVAKDSFFKLRVHCFRPFSEIRLMAGNAFVYFPRQGRKYLKKSNNYTSNEILPYQVNNFHFLSIVCFIGCAIQCFNGEWPAIILRKETSRK